MQKIRRTGYLLVLILLAALTTAFVWKPAPPVRFAGLDSDEVPYTVGGYAGRDVPVDAATKAALSSADIIQRHYRAKRGGRAIDFVLIGGTDRSALHDPRSCIIGSGWQIDNDRVESLSSSSGSVQARACLATLGESGASTRASNDILYLYVTHGRVIVSATEIRLALLESALMEQNDSPVYFIRFMTPAAQGPAYAHEHAALVSFAYSIWKRISPALLKGGQA